MSDIDERVERLIGRKLDGELSDEDQLELNKLLIRSPHVRRLLDEYARQDRLVASVMARELASDRALGVTIVTSAGQPGRPVQRPTPWTVTSLGGLLVACLALFAVLTEPPFRTGSLRKQTGPMLGGASMPQTHGSERGGDRFQLLPAHMEFPQTETERTDRQFIVVHGPNSGQYFVLELRNQRATATLVSGEL